MEIELKGAGVQYYSTNFQFFVLKFEFKKISSLCWSKGLFVYILRGRGGSKLKINLISKPSCKNQKTFISVDLLQSTLVENHAVKAGLVENHAVKAGLSVSILQESLHWDTSVCIQEKYGRCGLLNMEDKFWMFHVKGDYF